MMKPTGILFFPAFDWAISPTHPEREERLLYTRDQIFEEGIMDLPGIREYHPRLATAKEVARAHFCIPDVESRVTQAHMVSAGSAMVMADAFVLIESSDAVTIPLPRFSCPVRGGVREASPAHRRGGFGRGSGLLLSGRCRSACLGPYYCLQIATFCRAGAAPSDPGRDSVQSCFRFATGRWPGVAARAGRD